MEGNDQTKSNSKRNRKRFAFLLTGKINKIMINQLLQILMWPGVVLVSYFIVNIALKKFHKNIEKEEKEVILK